MPSELERHGITVFERGWLSSNNVLLRGAAAGGDNVLVDSGYWIHSDQTVALTRHALGGEPLGKVLNTHLHSDHCGGNLALQIAFGCPIDVPAGEAAAVDAWDMSKLTFESTGQYCPRFTRTGILDAPGKIAAGRFEWQVLAAPGHDPLSLAFYQPQIEVLISADALWENGFGVVFPEIEGESAFADVRKTLEAFSRLSVRWVIPGHGPPFSDAPGAIERALRRLDAFDADPVRHAVHAAKVLIKFRLLETQRESWASLMNWLRRTRYFALLRTRYFEDVSEESWVRKLVDEMTARGVLAINADEIRNTRGG